MGPFENPGFAMETESSGGASSQTGNEGGANNNFWSLLPSFDPATDNVKEYIDKVKFLEKVVPSKDKSMLAPRLALLRRGTAWAQVRAMDASKLADPNVGVKHFLAALAGWEESAEMKTFDLFERAVYKTTQRSDESTMSYVNRLQVAFAELGDVSIKKFQAFLQLRQSAIGVEDKKRILTMTNGKMDTIEIKKAMRTLSTMVLSNNAEPKKKVYPTNYVEPEQNDGGEVESTPASTFVAACEDDEMDPETFEALIAQGDEHALQVQAFEQDLSDMFQEVPDLQQALVSYQEARSKLTEKKKFRGFWLTKGKSKSAGKGFGMGPRKGSSKGYGKADLLAKIARTNCKICGERGHWKAECPRNTEKNTKDSVNLASHMPAFNMNHSTVENLPDHVIVEDESLIIHGLIGKEKAVYQQNDAPELCHTVVVDNHIQNNVCQFWVNRLLSRKKSISIEAPSDASMEAIVAATSHRKQFENDSVKGKFQGYAILDIGASRSVIGDDVLPYLIKSLPPSVRQLIYEVPSKVGFRFGNNQITHSFKQVRIPILRPRQRIWLVIEVVPNATPFLLSIQTMKTLGAQIDLSTNECYLSKLQRSLSLKESPNGLYLIDMKELCLEDSECNHAGHFSVQRAQHRVVGPPPGLESFRRDRNAFPEGDHGGDSHHSRGGDGITEVPVGDPHAFGGVSHHRPRAGDSPGSSKQDQHASPRGPTSEGSYRGDCPSLEASKPSESSEDLTTSGPSCSDADHVIGRRGRVGTGVFSSDRRRITGTGWSPLSGRDVSKSSSTSPTTNHDMPSSPIDDTKDANTSSTSSPSECSPSEHGPSGSGNQQCFVQSTVGANLTSPGTLGKQEGELGEKAHWCPVRGCVRIRPRLFKS